MSRRGWEIAKHAARLHQLVVGRQPEQSTQCAVRLRPSQAGSRAAMRTRAERDVAAGSVQANFRRLGKTTRVAVRGADAQLHEATGGDRCRPQRGIGRGAAAGQPLGGG
jgi:hypothetical protein